MTSRSTGLSILVLIVVAAAGWALYINAHSMDARMDTSIATTSVLAVSTSTVSASATPTSTDPGYAAGDTAVVTARIGQSVQVLGETITPTAIVEDSRCPTDVQCIWAGTVQVKATIDGGMGKSAVTFELGKESTTEVNSIALKSVSPAKNSKQEIAAGAYVLTFKVTRR